jgi:hypothetical protein
MFLTRIRLHDNFRFRNLCSWRGDSSNSYWKHWNELQPTYSWNQVTGSTWYYLWVDGPSGNVIKTCYTIALSDCYGTT